MRLLVADLRLPECRSTRVIATTLFHQAGRRSDRNVTATVVKEGLQLGITGKQADGSAFWPLRSGARLSSLRPGHRWLV